jgi:very-short-patch-repair endonuclease
MCRSSFPSRPSSQKRAVLSERAALMRHAPTESEARLFQALRGGRLGVTFRRQVSVLGRFIADLLASEVRLIVEIDGGYHAAREAKDAHRERALEHAGYTVLRLDAELVMRDVEAAVARVAEEVARLRRATL